MGDFSAAHRATGFQCTYCIKAKLELPRTKRVLRIPLRSSSRSGGTRAPIPAPEQAQSEATIFVQGLVSEASEV